MRTQHEYALALDRVSEEIMYHPQRSHETYKDYAKRILAAADGTPIRRWPHDNLLNAVYGKDNWGEQHRKQLGDALCENDELYQNIFTYRRSTREARARQWVRLALLVDKIIDYWQDKDEI